VAQVGAHEMGCMLAREYRGIVRRKTEAFSSPAAFVLRKTDSLIISQIHLYKQ
jgi:hypothetical protein